ncbi:hypothetical protein DVS28_a0929 [Euzebya pacifica]|uniref:Uncharacterized protein n=1 Tax=Euzebya pacifica TaxID=1608957 RepID=A0A346XTT3_9ACTN|nr:hypothetical protein [Euzebya pacifica]AXV05630.1 hypothetical protein DVS28_a0929 [Euzebya pacifica]
MAAIHEPLPPCPACGADTTRVTEDVSDEVTVLGCGTCTQTWAVRADDKDTTK